MSHMIWIPHSDLAWAAATLDKTTPGEAGKISVRLALTGAQMQIPGPATSYPHVTQEELDYKCDNLVELERINEGIILHHIKTRFQMKKIYTFVGAILVAVNPYQSLPDLYKEDMMIKARKKIIQGDEPLPHVYSIAATALVDMTNFRGDQSVLISGESGSGKTETTKKLLQYLSNSAGNKSSLDVSSAILDSNPVLEAFGNAKTLRNNNSSRFGKYMEVNYRRDDRKGGEIIGCNCISYLLEKSRVVHQTPGERNYHVFYMLLAGADSATQEEYKLRPMGEFRYLNQSDCMEIEGRDDRDEFNQLTRSFGHVGFSEPQRLQIMQALAGILHLGNVQFQDEEVGGGSRGAVSSTSKRDLQLAARLLEMYDPKNPKGRMAGLEAGAVALEKAMCYVMIRGAATAGGAVEIMERPLTAEQAANNRDALAKAAYDRLFDRIIYQVNKSLFKSREDGWNIGVLDIFGFEVFAVNSLEQLCINYCNEKLQTFFNDIIFDAELKYYREEEIEVSDITYKDNRECVLLIDAKAGGIFAQVADIAVNKQASDEDLCKKLNETFLERKDTKNEYFIRSKKRGAFAIRHFAGEVTYTADGFIEKNKDKLPDALTSAMAMSSLPLLNDDSRAWSEWQPSPDARNKVYPHPGSQSSNSKGGGPSNAAAREPLATKFKKDLESLVVELKKTTPQFIRCIKPNEVQKPSVLDAVLTLNQLKYSGLFEAIRIRQSGYPLRMTHEQFLSRYKHCVLSIPAKDKTKPRSYASALMEQLCVKISPPFPNVPGEPRNYAIGLTKVFIRKDAMGHALDECRENNAGNLVIHIQRIVRGFLAKCVVYKIVGEAKHREMQARKNEERERSLMEGADRESRPFNEKRRKKEANDRKAREEKAEQDRKAAEIRLQKQGKCAIVLQRLFYKWRDGVKGRRIMAERALELALQAENGQCADCYKVRPCLLHHTRACNAANLRKHLADALASKVPAMLQEAVKVADDNCTTHTTKFTKCACVFVKQEDPGRPPLKGYHSINRIDAASLREEEAAANWDPALAALPLTHVLYQDCCRELARHRREGSIAKTVLPSRPGLHCDCRLILLKRAISRPSASCQGCRFNEEKKKSKEKDNRAPREHRCLKTRAVVALQGSAKGVILDTLKESYLRQALKDAIAVNSDVLLQDAIDKVDVSKLATSPALSGIYRQAKDALLECAKLRATLANLTSALTHASTVPKLVSAADHIKTLVIEARGLGLGAELPVAEAVLRLAKINSLLSLRDRLRMAIEICSPSLMDSAIVERSKLVPLFGEQLLAEEAAGVAEMRRMVSYLTQIRDVGPDSEGALKLDGSEADLLSSTKGSLGAGISMSASWGTGSQQHDDEEGRAADRMLPRYVSRALEAVRAADPSSPAELEEAMERFATLVPNEALRKRYHRIFKWVVAYAHWKFVRPTSEGAADNLPAPPSESKEKIEVTVDKFGRKKFTGDGVTRDELKYFASRGTPGVSFGTPLKSGTSLKSR